MAKNSRESRSDRRQREHYERLRQRAERETRNSAELQGAYEKEFRIMAGLEATKGAKIIGSLELLAAAGIVAGAGIATYATRDIIERIIHNLAEVVYSGGETVSKASELIGLGQKIDERKVRQYYDDLLREKGQEEAKRIIKEVITEKRGRLEQLRKDNDEIRLYEESRIVDLEHLADEIGNLQMKVGEFLGFNPDESRATEGWLRDANIVRESLGLRPFKIENLELYKKVNEALLKINDEYNVSTEYQSRLQKLETEKAMGIIDLLRQGRSKVSEKVTTSKEKMKDLIKDLDGKLEIIEEQKLQLIELESELRLDERLAVNPVVNNTVNAKQTYETQQVVPEVGYIPRRQEEIDSLATTIMWGYGLAVAAVTALVAGRIVYGALGRFTNRGMVVGDIKKKDARRVYELGEIAKIKKELEENDRKPAD